MQAKNTPPFLPSVHVPVHPPLMNGRPAAAPGSAIPPVVLAVESAPIIPPSAPLVASVGGYIRVHVGGRRSTGWWASFRSPVSSMIRLIPIARTILRRGSCVRRSPISLPSWPAVVSISTTVYAVPTIAVSAVVPGCGVVPFRTNTYSASLWRRWQVGFSVMELSAVQLVTFFVCGYVLGQHW
jgi:hypothetical protein